MQPPATKYIWPGKSASQIYIAGPQGQQKFNHLKMTPMGKIYKPHIVLVASLINLIM